MEAAVRNAAKDLSGSLEEKLYAIIRDQLGARIAELDQRERELDARARDIAAREEALERREAALQQKPPLPDQACRSDAATAPPRRASWAPSAPKAKLEVSASLPTAAAAAGLPAAAAAGAPA
eukprot:CAMPEP_0171200366 /NCGR_PEP_ID=MMETSP0790-20130122/23942_1 /TAXON_ID=2925 /ORGANISM="Alexandrium catenella, Strain OF101" /LENGTH=122 /DNA_ID=CAMNT_0011665741 /DNA_START=47 /DNA_END=412 /DNA_ORIENTATION=+